ncbi:MAG TPA: FAD-linked oxidase C-terminal domain-containing protein [bacterium]|jgi:glycolate oxidase subunit GlcD|nr:FAD-linked oxidase C-terminal domain-containing protein [bacterium]
MPLSPRFLDACRRLLGPAHVLTSAAALTAYDNDALTQGPHRPEAVVLPGSAEELKQVLAWARLETEPYTLRGAGTGLSGGAVAVQGGLLIHLSRLKRILSVDAANLVAEVEPGVVHAALNKALEAQGLFYPPDPSSGFACTLGGNVAENAGGIRCFKYGVTANYVLGLEVMTPAGEVVRLGGPAGGLGAAGGSNWKALFTGSEGMLGCFLRIWLRLKPLPEATRTFLATYASVDQATAAIVDLVHHPLIPVAAELMDPHCVRLVELSPFKAGLDPESWALLAEISGPQPVVDGYAGDIEALLRKHSAGSVRSTEDPAERLKLWKARKVGGGLPGQVSPDVMVQDAVIPRTRLAEVLADIYRESEAEGIPVINLFHAGDGNLHPNFMFDARIPGQAEAVRRLGKRLMEKVISVGGTLSGEHGIGSDKMEYLPLLFSPADLAAQAAVAATFNPDSQLNPGKLLPQRRFRRPAPEGARA